MKLLLLSVCWPKEINFKKIFWSRIRNTLRLKL